MLLRGRDGQSIDLRLAGYQFPAARTVADAKWLVVAGRVDHPRGSWAFQDPCLETTDVFSLAGWFEAVARGAEDRQEEGFTEPNLEFRLVGSGAERRLRVYFELESRPPWAASNVVGEDDLWVEFALRDLDLVGAARSLRDQLEQLR
jgi:hypothetical protein